MSYTPTVWVDDSAPFIDAANLNKLETFLASLPSITTSALSGGPPASPADKDIWIATGVDANGTRWSFQYNAGSGSAYKWEFIGGCDLASNVGNLEGFAGVTNAWTDATTTGPTLTIARAGEYFVAYSAVAVAPGAATGFLQVGVAVGAGTPPDEGRFDAAASNMVGTIFSKDMTHTFAANDVARMRYFQSVAGWTVELRKLFIRPRRIS